MNTLINDIAEFTLPRRDKEKGDHKKSQEYEVTEHSDMSRNAG